MVYVVVSTAILAACLILAIRLLSLARAERWEGYGKTLADGDLFASGAKEAAKRQVSRSGVISGARRNTPLARQLRAAGIALDPLLWRALSFGLVIVVFVGVWLISGQGIYAMFAAAVVPVVVHVTLRQRTDKRRVLLDAQFADALPRIAASVRGSLTLERALRVAAVHMEDPLREEFVRVLADAAYGMPLHEALEAMAQRTQSADVKMLAAATKLRQSRGGSVAAALSMISTRVHGRLKSSRELRTEVASTRMAKWFVAAAMPAIFAIMYATNADFAYFYMREPLGWTVLGIAAFLEVLGLVVAHKVTTLGSRANF